ncbi:hypothetical protein AK812_SmicGene5462 [Symbiodinium microadriaticum]|uniref:Uncharacterized protein n=1 Tax=Symbiodinium microadriaticum TaxID=2951 RepID=A0A1Q9ETQ2_SYMMI|nr:hypothetical protein AK812_SmicGene5462 [Symbiodinium microadriaticum]
MVGAAGVLALPKRLASCTAGEEIMRRTHKLLVSVPPYQQYDASKAERKFKRYVEEATKAHDIEWVPDDGVDLDQDSDMQDFMFLEDLVFYSSPRTQLAERNAQSAMLSCSSIATMYYCYALHLAPFAVLTLGDVELVEDPLRDVSVDSRSPLTTDGAQAVGAFAMIWDVKSTWK